VRREVNGCWPISGLVNRLLAHNRAFVAVNDGPAFAAQLMRYLAGASPGVDTHPGEGSCL